MKEEVKRAVNLVFPGTSTSYINVQQRMCRRCKGSVCDYTHDDVTALVGYYFTYGVRCTGYCCGCTGVTMVLNIVDAPYSVGGFVCITSGVPLHG